MTTDDLTRLLERAHANLDAHPDRYPPRQPASTYTFMNGASRAEAIRRAASGETYSAIARTMGVSHSTIRRAVLGITQERPAC